jgi:hypothetical protein
MEPDTKKWIIVGIILALAIVAVIVFTVVIDDGTVPAGKIAGCEPCTPGCACDAGLVDAADAGGP